MQDALGALEAMAMALEGEIRAPRPRVCPGADGEIWIDLGDESWRCLKVTSQAWEIVADADVPLIRPPGMLALPGLVRAPGALDRLRALLNMPTEAGFQLVVMWMLAALRPAGPYPLLALDGEQGSGKSTASKMVRRLVDPNAADVRAAPGNERDLLVAARGSQVLALDNLSFVLEDMADGLCRLATGGGFGERMLYTNGEEYLIYACNPVLLNGINSVLHRGDLADRAIAVTLLPIPDERRRPESEVWTEFEAAAPGVLAALLDGLVVALRRLPEVKLERLPRMADFARLACAAAPAFGWSEEEVLEALEANRAKTDAGVVDADPISIAVTEIADTLGANGVWEGTATRLLEQISETVPKERRNQKDWPKDATRLSPKLRRLAPALRKSGVEVTMPQGGGRAGRMIVIRLTDEAAGDERPMPPEEAHRLLEDAGKGMEDLLLDGFPVW